MSASISPHCTTSRSRTLHRFPPTWCANWLMGMLRVVLSGDGGDETFAGYRRYKICLDRWRKVHGMPLSIRTRLGRLETVIGNAGWRLLGPRDPFCVSEVKTWRRKIGKVGQHACNWQARYPQHLLANNLNHCFAIDELIPAARTPATPPPRLPTARHGPGSMILSGPCCILTTSATCPTTFWSRWTAPAWQ